MNQTEQQQFNLLEAKVKELEGLTDEKLRVRIDDLNTRLSEEQAAHAKTQDELKEAEETIADLQEKLKEAPKGKALKLRQFTVDKVRYRFKRDRFNLPKVGVIKAADATEEQLAHLVKISSGVIEEVSKS